MSHDLSPLGFRKTPFTRELQVRECFPLDPQAQVAAALTKAVQERMSAALIAPAGTGKTVALRMLVAALPETRFQVHYVKVTGLSKRDLCKEIAVACGLSPTGIFPALVRKLQDAFAPCRPGSRPAVPASGSRPISAVRESPRRPAPPTPAPRHGLTPRCSGARSRVGFSPGGRQRAPPRVRPAMRRTLRTDTPARWATSIWSWPAASRVWT